MIIYGTGKSKVIQTVMEAFTVRGQSDLLIKAAYTGVAASLIDGKTTHMIGRMLTYGRKSTTVAQKTAPMFAYYIKTHVLLNAGII